MSYSEAIDSEYNRDSTIVEPLSSDPIVFSGPSDALVASLRLEHRLSVPMINLFLRVLRDPRFEPAALTFDDAADVDRHVAACRRETRDKRAARVGDGAAYASTLPYPILDGVLDALATDPQLYDDPLDFQASRPNEHTLRRDDTFRTLSLVHRSWTVPSQQRLAKRIVVRSASSLVKLLRSPVVGSATSELVISLGTLWNRGFSFMENTLPSTDAGDVEFDIVHLLARTPRLRSLHILESGLHESLLLARIAQTRSLRSLTWLRTHGYPDCDFALLCAALNGLPDLRELDISGWTFRGAISTATTTTATATAGRMYMAEMPTFSLESLRVGISPGERLVAQVGWLMQTLVRDGNAKLVLDVTLVARFSTREVLRVFPGSEEALAALGNLHILNKSGFEESNLDEMRAFLRVCKNVKSLHIQSKNVAISEFLDDLPASVEVLCYSWFDMWASPWNIVEAHLPRLISGDALPELRQVIISNYEVPFYHLPPRSIEAAGHPAPCTQAACDERGVLLDLTSRVDVRDF